MTLDLLLFMISLLALLMMVWGLILPARAFLGKTATRGKVGKVYGLAFIAFFATALAMAPKKGGDTPAIAIAAATPEDEPVTPAAEPVLQPAKTLGMLPSAFRENYNAVVGSVDARYEIPKITIQPGQVNDIFNSSLAANVSVIGSVDKRHGEIQSLMVILAGGNEVDPARPVLALLAVSQVANPDVPKEDVAKEVMDIIGTAMKNLESGDSYERTLGRVKYVASANKLTGLMLSIAPAD
ncbi:MAG: hypothetical protein WC997_14320 [Porticoccaceae bacterium]